MKANEVPEKIYISPNLENRTWLIGKGDTSFVEYTRTDAFIERACKWLRKGGSGWYLCFEFGEDEIDFVKLAEDFKKYMKGE